MYFLVDVYRIASVNAIVLGFGVIVICLDIFIYPLAHTKEKFINDFYTVRFTKLKVLSLERNTLSQISRE